MGALLGVEFTSTMDNSDAGPLNRDLEKVPMEFLEIVSYSLR